MNEKRSSIRRTGNEESSSSLSKKAANLDLVLSISESEEVQSCRPAFRHVMSLCDILLVPTHECMLSSLISIRVKASRVNASGYEATVTLSSRLY